MNKTAFFSSHSTLAVLAFFLAFWFALLALSGTLTSGYHFMDDHDLLRIRSSTQATSLGREAHIFQRDLLAPSWRFRPFYNLHRRMTVALFGCNFFILSVYAALLAVIVSQLLFMFMRRCDFSPTEALLFVLLTQLGSQTAVWWRLGYNEAVGMVMLAAALYFMACSVATTARRRLAAEALFVLFAVLASWSKESFILLLPALLLWKAWLTRRAGRTWRKTLHEIAPAAFILLPVCLSELWIIRTKVIPFMIDGTGFSGFGIEPFLSAAAHLLVSARAWTIPLLLVLLGATLAGNRDGNETDRQHTAAKELAWALLLTAAIAMPQIVLYMKNGISERYLLPAMIAFSLLDIVLLRLIRERGGRHADKPAGATAMAILLLSAAIALNFLVAKQAAAGFAGEGKQINNWLRSARQYTTPDARILVITANEHHEATYAVRAYLNLEMGRKNVLFATPRLAIPQKNMAYLNELNRDFLNRFPGYCLPPPVGQPLDAVLLLPGLENSFLTSAHSWFKPRRYVRYANPATFVAYFRKPTDHRLQPAAHAPH